MRWYHSAIIFVNHNFTRVFYQKFASQHDITNEIWCTLNDQCEDVMLFPSPSSIPKICIPNSLVNFDEMVSFYHHFCNPRFYTSVLSQTFASLLDITNEWCFTLNDHCWDGILFPAPSYISKYFIPKSLLNFDYMVSLYHHFCKQQFYTSLLTKILPLNLTLQTSAALC